jgi:hypothetical protein
MRYLRWGHKMGEELWLVAGSATYQVEEISGSRWVLFESGLGMPPVEHVVQRAPLQHGATRLFTRLAPRTVEVSFVDTAVDASGRWANRRALMEMLKAFDTLVLRKVLPDGQGSYDLAVVYAGGAEFSSADDVYPRWSKVGIRLLAHNPVWAATDPSTVTVGLPSYPDAGQLPWTFPIMFGASAINRDMEVTYGGTWLVYPEIDVRGPVTNPTVENLTTGEKLAIEAEVLEDEVIRFSLDPLEKTVTNITDDTSWLGYLSTDSDLATFHLAASPEAPGGINALRFYGFSAGADTAITLRWHDQYIGL